VGAQEGKGGKGKGRKGKRRDTHRSPPLLILLTIVVPYV